MYKQEEEVLTNQKKQHLGSSLNGFSHTFQTPLKNQNIQASDIFLTQQKAMNDDSDFEHHSSSGENGRVNFHEVLKRSQLFDNRNHPKFVHASL